MKILLTGGLGYIGSHTAVEVLNAGHDVVVIDDLSNSNIGVIESIKKITGKEIKFYEDDVLSKYMEINQCGIREVEEAYMYDKTNLDKALKLIKKTFFDNKDKVIIDKTKTKKEDKENELF